jgi:hypothetical protein
MPFELQVDFSGLCLYVHDPDQHRVAVLMPDARELLPPKGPHPDGTFGMPHAGYLRFNLADLPELPDLASHLPLGDDDRPQYEVVHLFNRQVLGFEITGEDGPIAVNTRVPDLEAFAPNPDGMPGARLVPIDGVFSPAPPAALLMRTIFEGGTLTGMNVRENWFIPNLFNSGSPANAGIFANLVRWTRQVESVAIRLSGFDGTGIVRIPLRPAGSAPDIVRIKVANLCSTNPMEWPELGIRAADRDDEDFKWLYRILKPRAGTYEDLLMGHRLPFPHLPPNPPAGVEDCLGLKTTGSVPPA